MNQTYATAAFAGRRTLQPQRHSMRDGCPSTIAPEPAGSSQFEPCAHVCTFVHRLAKPLVFLPAQLTTSTQQKPNQRRELPIGKKNRPHILTSFQAFHFRLPLRQPSHVPTKPPAPLRYGEGGPSAKQGGVRFLAFCHLSRPPFRIQADDTTLWTGVKNRVGQQKSGYLVGLGSKPR